MSHQFGSIFVWSSGRFRRALFERLRSEEPTEGVIVCVLVTVVFTPNVTGIVKAYDEVGTGKTEFVPCNVLQIDSVL